MREDDMGYISQVTGYRNDLLCNGSIIEKGMYALLEPDSLIKSVIPSFQECKITILPSLRLGTSLVDYLLPVDPGRYNRAGFDGEDIETFLYPFEGSLKIWDEDETAVLTKGGYIFCPEGRLLHFESLGGNVRASLYKRKYVKQESRQVHTVIANTSDVDWMGYENMADVRVKDFLPARDDPDFDMNSYILSFKPGASHGYAETHVQEYGVYIYSGQDMYPLDHGWIPVKKGDYLSMGAYCLQVAYETGRDEEFAYIYSKDCNRDVFL